MSDRTKAASAIQFPLRGLALVTAAVGIYFAALAPWLRQYNSTQLWRFWLFWLGILGGSVAVLVLFGVLQRRAELRAGDVHYVLSLAGGAFIRPIFVLFGIFQVAVCTQFAFIFSGWENTSSDSAPALLDPLLLMAPTLGAGTATALVMIWWRADRVQLREEGLLMSLGLIPWKSIQSWRWMPYGSRPTLCVKTGRREIHLRVGASDRSGVDEFLAQRVPSADST